MTKHPWKPHGLALLLFLVKAGSAAPAPSHYKVTGAGLVYSGVYEERREPELYYKKLGDGWDDRLGHRFLYKGSQHGDTWIIGRGKTLSTAKAEYRAPAVEGRPPADQWWTSIEDGSREGKEVGNLMPEIRVVGVETETARFLYGEELETCQYNVTGAGFPLNGVYEERREPELHYYNKFPGSRSYLYKGSQHGNTWILGRGETLSRATAIYRAPAVEGRPPADQWSRVGDKSREGKEEGLPEPGIKVVGVETKMETELETELETEKDTELETNNCLAPQPILKSISLAILVLTVINILC